MATYQYNYTCSICLEDSIYDTDETPAPDPLPTISVCKDGNGTESCDLELQS